MVSQENRQTPVTFRLNHPKHGGYQYAKISGLAPMPQSLSRTDQNKATIKNITSMLSPKSTHRTRQPVLVFCSPEQIRKKWCDDKIWLDLQKLAHIKKICYCPQKITIKFICNCIVLKGRINNDIVC